MFLITWDGSELKSVQVDRAYGRNALMLELMGQFE